MGAILGSGWFNAQRERLRRFYPEKRHFEEGMLLPELSLRRS
jgi:hypothetical protein